MQRRGRPHIFWDVALRPQLAILFAEPGELLALGGGVTGAAVRAIGLRSAHPQAQGRRRQIEITGDRADHLVMIQDQANGLAAKILIKLPAWAPTFPALGHSGHRIHLSEDVHRFGSSPRDFELSGEEMKPAAEGCQPEVLHLGPGQSLCDALARIAKVRR